MANILVVHDNQPQLSELAAKVSNIGHTALSASSVDMAISTLKSNETDIIITDSSNPETMGLSFCQKIREHSEFKDVPLMLVTSAEDLTHMTQAYEAGADECIAHPIQEAELKAKAVSILKNSKLRKSLHEKAERAKETALAALKDSSDMGDMNRFLQESFEARSFEELVKLMFKVIERNGLTACIQLYADGEVLDFSHDGIINPIEAELLEKLYQGNQRIVARDRICMFRGYSCCLLVRNLPIENEIQYGRLKDTLIILLDGMDARLRSLTLELKMVSHQNLAWTSITDIEGQFKVHEKNTIQIMDDLMQDMNSAMQVLDLTEQQEEYFLNLVDQSMERLVSLYSSGIMIDQGLLKLRELLTDSCQIIDQFNINSNNKK